MSSDASANIARNETASRLESVGSQLRSAREAAGLSAAQLAESLHMGHEQLDALERGERERLPEPVFIKAMTRRVAARLQLDADPLIHELTIALAAEQKGQSPQKSAAKPSPAVSNTRVSNAQSESTPSATLWKSVATIALLGGVGVGSALVFAKQRPMPTPAVAVNAALPQPAPETAKPATTTEAEPSLTSPSAAPDVTETVTVTVTSQEPSWLEVRNADLETVYAGTLNDETPLTVNPGDEIYAGRPDLVFISNGNNQPQPLGDISDIRWHKITPER
ncbi:MAG: helix-turn-helix domain-containing protein [Synechococcus sp.]|uniref:helix-turn-helix domain-containing protein n=1 Tax=Synechococcus sp. BMK-MC-1 TaxID=1442551 RepID=UPI00186134A6|nr:helix-turn-helix domain-containing protein [Synechococcus sp. BMK-MC-1]QNI68254.1 transcriptional regulator with a Cro/C1-type helix-turn-helix domain [Synechococcus sp. BMK-MC-1]